jgi:Rrf2 family transcriptional regulator, cysteine metabolism repressor
MKLWTRVRYGARALCALARNYPSPAISLTVIARREGISVKYLEQIMMPLRSAGLVVANAGAKGGYALSRPPTRIRMSEVYEALDASATLVPCLLAHAKCPRAKKCPTQPLWAAVNRAIQRELHGTRLSDLIRGRHSS